jgi:hypothetical protein
MRIAFLLVLLAGAAFYAYVAFAELSFLGSTGRLGPGFFPRLIGVAAVAMVLWAMADELRGGISRDGTARGWREVAVLAALALGYAALIRLFGGLAATFAFLLVTLWVLDRGRPLRALAVALAVPGLVYLLFDLALNANMPPALVGLPL